MALTEKNKKMYLIGGAAGLAIVGFLYIRNKNSSSAANTAASTSIDPATGYAYGSPEDLAALAEQQQTGTIDPSTGYAYGSAQDTAALAAQSGSSGYYNPVGTTTSTITTNAEWEQEAESLLASSGYNGTTVAAALNAYLAGLPLTSDQQSIVQVALAEAGNPPVGSFSIIPVQTPPAGTTTTPNPTAPGSPAPTGVVKTAPTGFRVVSVTGGDNVNLAWNPVAGANGYVIAYGPTSGSQKYKQGVGGGSSSASTVAGVGAGSAGKHYFELWATPAATGGPHAGPIEATTTKS
jgi:hypothetical protein